MKYFILISLLFLSVLSQEAKSQQEVPVATYKGTLSDNSSLPNVPCEIDVYAVTGNLQPIRMTINNDYSERIELKKHLFNDKRSSMTSRENTVLDGKNLYLTTNVNLNLSQENQATLNYFKTWSTSDVFPDDSAVQKNHYYCVASLTTK